MRVRGFTITDVGTREGMMVEVHQASEMLVVY